MKDSAEKMLSSGPMKGNKNLEAKLAKFLQEIDELKAKIDQASSLGDDASQIQEKKADEDELVPIVHEEVSPP